MELIDIAFWLYGINAETYKGSVRNTMTEKRQRNKRSKVWPETKVTLEYRDAMASFTNTLVKSTVRIDNLSASGMFALTGETIPSRTEVRVVIDFNPGIIEANGVVVRTEERGVAIKFTNMDPLRLGELIMAKLNHQSNNRCSAGNR